MQQDTSSDVRAILRLETADRAGETLRSLAAEVGGRTVSTPDGAALLFDDPLAAIRCALTACSRDHGKAVRVGGHLGAAGLPVEALSAVASPLARLARPGQFLVSKELFDAGRLEQPGEAPLGAEVRWMAHGTYEFTRSAAPTAEPIELFEIGLEPTSPLTPPGDGDEARRLEDDVVLPGWRPACGISASHAPGWKLKRRLEADGSLEAWIALHLDTYEKRIFKFIYNRETIHTLKWRTFWLHQLKRSLGRCKRIVRVYEFDLDATPPFIETAPESGDRLRDLPDLARIPMPLRVDIVTQIADTLAVAHNFGVIHGNLGPDNVLVKFSSQGIPRVRLRNFAIPPPPAVSARLYQIPTCGDSRSACTGGDVYAFGVLFYQIICGNLTKPLGSRWQEDIVDDSLKEGILSAATVFKSGRHKNLRAIAETLRGEGSGAT